MLSLIVFTVQRSFHSNRVLRKNICRNLYLTWLHYFSSCKMVISITAVAEIQLFFSFSQSSSFKHIRGIDDFKFTITYQRFATPEPCERDVRRDLTTFLNAIVPGKNSVMRPMHRSLAISNYLPKSNLEGNSGHKNK